MKQNQHQKNEFLLCIITFHGNVSQFVMSLLLIMVTFRVATTQEFSKQNVYVNELNIVLLYAFCSDEFKYRYNASNLYRVTHDNRG